MCLKIWGPISKSNIKNVRLTYERIMLTFEFFNFFFNDIFNFLFPSSFHAFGKAENVFLLASSSLHYSRIHKISHVNSRIDKNLGELVCF